MLKLSLSGAAFGLVETPEAVFDADSIPTGFLAHLRNLSMRSANSIGLIIDDALGGFSQIARDRHSAQCLRSSTTAVQHAADECNPFVHPQRLRLLDKASKLAPMWFGHSIEYMLALGADYKAGLESHFIRSAKT
jgi:hypothetical protein